MCSGTAYPPNTLPIYLPSYNLYTMVVYRPPSISGEEDHALRNFIYHFSLGKELILLGDFNLPSIRWHEPIPDAQPTQIDTLYFDFFTTLGLHQQVFSPTFVVSGNVLDFELTSEHDRVTTLAISPPFPNYCHTPVHFLHTFHNNPTSRISSNNPLRYRDWARGS